MGFLFVSTAVIITSSVHGLLLLDGVVTTELHVAVRRITASVLVSARTVGFECRGTIVFGLVVLAMVTLVECGGVLLVVAAVLIGTAVVFGGVVGGCIVTASDLASC